MNKRLLVIGQVKPAILNQMSLRYLVEVAHNFSTIQELMGPGRALMQNGNYSAALIGGGIDADKRKQILNFLDTRNPRPAIAVLTNDTSYGQWSALKPAASPDDIAEALDLHIRKKPAQIVIVSITKGGAGKSTISTNTAISLAQRGHKVALIDDDPTSRSVRPLMGIPKDTPLTSTNFIADVESQSGVITPALIEKYLIEAHGVYCLVGSSSIVSQFPVTEDIAKDVLAVLGYELGFDFVVIDAPPDVINSSSYSYHLLRTTENSPSPPIVLVPVAPETLVTNSAEDTVAAVTHLKHPMDRIWPVISCTQITHDPRALAPPNTALWRDPVAIVPYCQDARGVADTGRPFVTMEPQPLWHPARWWEWFVRRVVLDVADIPRVKAAFVQLATAIEQHAPRED